MADRRQHERHPFSATAEVVDMTSGAHQSVRAADLSQKGCYLDSLNPSAIGSKVRVRILWDGVELTCLAVVRDAQPGMGMGVAFVNLDSAQNALIENWIKKLSSGVAANLSSPPLSDSAKPAPPPDRRDDLAVRLIDLLREKGVLNDNEVDRLFSARML